MPEWIAFSILVALIIIVYQLGYIASQFGPIGRKFAREENERDEREMRDALFRL